MPSVPIYDNRQVASTALPGARERPISPELYKADDNGIGNGLTALGNNVNNIAVNMQERENADMLFRAETAMKDEYLKHEQAIRSRKGQNAWGATTETEKWFEEQTKKHSEGLTNEVQRHLFGIQATKLRQASVGSISAYEDDQRRVSLEESARASIVGSTNLAATAAREPGGEAQLTGLKGDIAKRIDVLAKLNGWDPERRAVEESRHLTNFHKQVISSMAVEDPKRAKAYFESNRGEIGGADQTVIEGTLKEGELRTTAQEATDKIADMPLDEALAYVRKNYEGDEEDEIVRRVKERHAEAEAIKQKGKTEASNEAWNYVVAGAPREGIPLDVWNRIDSGDRKSILEYIDARAKRLETDGMDDPENLGVVETMIEQGDITDKNQLGRYEPYFTKSTLKTLRTKIDKRGTVPPVEMRRIFEERKGAKVNVAKMNDAERGEWMAFQDYVLANVQETKRPEDIDVWADRWFMKGYGKDDGALTNDPDTLGEARAQGRGDFVIATPEPSSAMVDDSLAVIERSGVPMPADRKLARDEFYTKYYLDAERWFNAHSIPASPKLAAAYALLRQRKVPVTPANLEYIAGQLK